MVSAAAPILVSAAVADLDHLSDFSFSDAGHPQAPNIKFDTEGFNSILTELAAMRCRQDEMSTLLNIRHHETEARLDKMEASLSTWEHQMEEHLTFQQHETEARLIDVVRMTQKSDFEAQRDLILDSMTPQTDTRSSKPAMNDSEKPKVINPSKTTTSCEIISKVVAGKRSFKFRQSVHDAVFFVFMEHVSLHSSMLIIAGFLINLMMQLVIVLILHWEFIADPLPDTYIESLRDWRASDGHAYYNTDEVTEASLVSRVCRMDPGLSMSTSQVAITKKAIDYGGHGSVGGQFMCMVSILLHTFAVARDLRKSVQFLLALCNLPQCTCSTTFAVESSGFSVLDLNRSRFMIGCVMFVCRCTIGMLLLIYGSWWLAYTADIKLLLIRSHAISWFLGIDEIIFGCIATPSLIGLIENMTPIRYSTSRRLLVIPCTIAVFTISSMIFIFSHFSSHINNRLNLTYDILCSDKSNQDFVVGTNGLGWIVYADVSPDAKRTSAAGIARREAMQFLIDRDLEAQQFVHKLAPEETHRVVSKLKNHVAKSVGEIASEAPCEDTSGGKLGWNLWLASGNTSFKNVADCAQMSRFCRASNSSLLARNIRLMCPITCGCHDPMGGLWDLASELSGCPWTSCQVLFARRIQEKGPQMYPCRDMPLIDLQTNTSWRFMLYQMHRSAAIGSSLLENLTETGCTAFQFVEPSRRMLLCGLYDVFNIKAYGTHIGAGVMCPESCGCYYEPVAGTKVAPGDYVPGDVSVCPITSCRERFKAAKMSLVSDKR